MKVIKVTTDDKVSVHEFPVGNHSEQNKVLRALIGDCDRYERVMPKRLYTHLGMKPKASNIPGEAVCMLVDEEGILKHKPGNTIGGYLYQTDVHGCMIAGNILFIGEVDTDDGIDFCGIQELELETLYAQLISLAHYVQRIKEDKLCLRLK